MDGYESFIEAVLGVKDLGSHGRIDNKTGSREWDIKG